MIAPDTAARARALVSALTHVTPDRVEMLAPDSYAAALAELDAEWNAACEAAAFACREERISGGSPSWNGAMEVCADAVEALKRPAPERPANDAT